MRANLIIASLVLIPLSALGEPARYELDPEHTTVAFLVDHMGYASVLGVFGEISGGFTYNMDTRDLNDLSVNVATGSLDSFNAARSEHVRSDDFLNVQDFPEMTFTADSGSPESDTSGKVIGELTLLGQTQPLTLDVELNKADDYPFGHGRFTLGLSVRGSLMRSDWGMTYSVDNGLVGDEVRLVIETEAVRVK